MPHSFQKLVSYSLPYSGHEIKPLFYTHTAQTPQCPQGRAHKCAHEMGTNVCPETQRNPAKKPTAASDTRFQSAPLVKIMSQCHSIHRQTKSVRDGVKRLRFHPAAENISISTHITYCTTLCRAKRERRTKPQSTHQTMMGRTQHDTH